MARGFRRAMGRTNRSIPSGFRKTGRHKGKQLSVYSASTSMRTSGYKKAFASEVEAGNSLVSKFFGDIGGLKDINDNMNAFYQMMLSAMRASIYTGGETIMSESLMLCPIDTGYLRSSAYLLTSDKKNQVEFSELVSAEIQRRRQKSAFYGNTAYTRALEKAKPTAFNKSVDSYGISIGYTAGHFPYVHEINYKHVSPTTNKFLEKAVNKELSEKTAIKKLRTEINTIISDMGSRIASGQFKREVGGKRQYREEARKSFYLFTPGKGVKGRLASYVAVTKSRHEEEIVRMRKILLGMVENSKNALADKIKSEVIFTGKLGELEAMIVKESLQTRGV